MNWILGSAKGCGIGKCQVHNEDCSYSLCELELRLCNEGWNRYLQSPTVVGERVIVIVDLTVNLKGELDSRKVSEKKKVVMQPPRT